MVSLETDGSVVFIGWMSFPTQTNSIKALKEMIMTIISQYNYEITRNTNRQRMQSEITHLSR